ncbi:melanoma-associated antigen 10-like [Nannospalax galili]|uniref:melanoma-associated antigen 10-like n=1 Tax=Nannospalax galili TaxID=1026970 RepID=UPI00111BFB61|nr:melanoma-associated antigen 10-like [Nannospalax galili]
MPEAEDEEATVTTSNEVLNEVTRDYEEYSLVIFSEVSECLKLIFGIDVIEMDPSTHSYILVISQGPPMMEWCMVHQCGPNVGLIIMALCVIFMESN